MRAFEIRNYYVRNAKTLLLTRQRLRRMPFYMFIISVVFILDNFNATYRVSKTADVQT